MKRAIDNIEKGETIWNGEVARIRKSKKETKEERKKRKREILSKREKEREKEGNNFFENSNEKFLFTHQKSARRTVHSYRTLHH